MNRIELLYVDDEPSVLHLYQRILNDHDYAVTALDDGWRAIQLVKENPGRFKLLITDCHMPKFDGIALIETARKLRFTGKIMVVTGGLKLEEHLHLQALDVDCMIFKPVAMDAFLTAVNDLVRKEASAGEINDSKNKQPNAAGCGL